LLLSQVSDQLRSTSWRQSRASPLAARPEPRARPGSGRGPAPGHRPVHSYL